MEAKVRDLDEAEQRRVLEANTDSNTNEKATGTPPDDSPPDGPSGRWDTDSP